MENADVSDLTLALSFFVAFFAGVAFKAALVTFFFAGVAAAFFTVLAAVFFFASVAFAFSAFFSAFFSCFFFSFLSVLMTSSRLQRYGHGNTIQNERSAFFTASELHKKKREKSCLPHVYSLLELEPLTEGEVPVVNERRGHRDVLDNKDDGPAIERIKIKRVRQSAALDLYLRKHSSDR